MAVAAPQWVCVTLIFTTPKKHKSQTIQRKHKDRIRQLQIESSDSISILCDSRSWHPSVLNYAQQMHYYLKGATVYFVLNQHGSFTGRIVNVPRTWVLQKNNRQVCSLLHREETNVLHPEKNSLERKPGMLRCYGAFNLGPSPSSNMVLWPSCNLDVLTYTAVLAVHLGDAKLLTKKAESEANLRHWISVKILLVILLQDRNQSSIIPASAIINQLVVQ